MYILSTTVSEIFKDDILWPWIGVEVFLFSSMFIVEQQGSQQFKKLCCSGIQQGDKDQTLALFRSFLRRVLARWRTD